MKLSENFTLTEYDPVTKIGDIFTVSLLNDSSPGPLYANTGVITDVKVEELINIEVKINQEKKSELK